MRGCWGCSDLPNRYAVVVCGYAINKWKQGSDPLVPALQTAADFLGVTLDYLTGRDR